MLKDIRDGGSFTALDEDGRQHRIHILVEVIDAGSKGDPDAELEGLKSLKTDDGSHVNRNEKGVYEIVATGQVLRSDDPNAP